MKRRTCILISALVVAAYLAALILGDVVVP